MVRKKTRLMTAAAALLAVLAALLVAIPLMSTKSAAENVFEFVTGINDDGSLIKESKTYTSISTPADFQKINESEDTLAGNYVLESDIILPADWESIGSKSGAFTGCFEGKGHTITIGADTTGSNMKTVPFFNNNGVIHNVKVTGTVSVNTYFGSVVSANNSGNNGIGYVIDCSSDADITVTGSGYVGGIVGDNNGTVYKCQFTGTLATETMNGASYYGGITGSNSGTVDSCANYGSVRGCVNVGGIAGQNDRNGTVKDCLNAVDISANATGAGGITGSNFGTISSSFTSGNVTLAAYSYNTSYGGICSSNSGTVTTTYYDRGQFPGDGIGDGGTVDYACGVYPWEIEDVELPGWNSAQVTKDSGDTSKKRTTEYSLPYPDGASPANKTSSLFRFETKDGYAWKSYTLITTADELKAISNNLDGSYVLENDITLSGNWEPLGMNYGSRFTGCFDGNGHTIKGLNVNEPSGSYHGYGLFGYVTGSIVDVNVEGNVQTSRPYVGGIVGYTDGAFIKDCSFNGSVSSTNAIWVGGIVGFASGGTEISGCYSSGSVTAKSSVSGGIVGDLTGKLTDCFSSAEVSGTFNVGGIIGSVNNNPTVTNCIFAGKVNYTEGPHGGISGQEGGSYTNCYYLSGSFDSSDYDTKDGTALSLVELASLTADKLSSAWESGSVGTDLTVSDSKYHTYKKNFTFPKLVKMTKAVTGSAEVYNFGIDGNDDYQAFTAVKTVDDLKNIEKDITGNYVIMVDELDASGMETLCDYNKPFAGKLAGNGCKLTLSKPLFGCNSGLVMDINAAGTIDGSSKYYYGAIAQQNSGGTIYGCSFSGSVTAGDYAGGICGINMEKGVIRKCYNTGTVTAQNEFAGGIVGLTASSTTVSECYNTGSVSGKESVGGIAGESEDYSKISDCLNTGRITGENHVGGIVGVDDETTVTRVLNASIAYAPGYYGCISGASTDSSYNNCYFIAELSAANYSGKGTGVSIGNIAGLNLGSAWNTGSLGTLSAADSNGFKSQPVTLPSLKEVGTAQTAVAYQFNFKENPSDVDNWLYTTRVTTVDELQTACTTGNIALANDIVFTDSDPAFMPLGVNSTEPKDNLQGYFSGNGHTINNIKLKGDNTYKDAALFTWSFGVIMDLTMDGTITVTDAEYAAAVCANNAGTIIRCHNAADISGGSDVGGIAYSNDGTIINCWNTGSITGESSASGICYVVYSNGKITGCYNIGALSAYSTYGISATTDKDKIQNSYYKSDAPGNAINAKTAKAFASGEVAYLLNGDQSTIAWGQEIGINSYPVPGGMRVYASSPCVSIFTNDNSDLHKEHDYVDGKCKNCGEYKAPSQDADGYYLLGSKSELAWFAQAVNDGSNDINAKLTADITLNENVLNGSLANGDFEQWEPIGNDDNPYIGIFDGNGHTVSGMCVFNNGKAGLFGLIEEARISNLTVADSCVSGQWAGGIVGFAENSVIENCVNRGYVEGDFAGGITSVMGDYSDKTDCGIRGCVNTGKVAGYMLSGGIVSNSDFDIKDCANYGSVEPLDSAYRAGITAYIEKNCSIINCLSVGTVYGDTSSPMVCYAIEYDDDGDYTRYTPTADNIKNSYYNKDLFALDGSEEMNWLEENCGKTTLELTSGNIFGTSGWTKPDNDFENKTLYYPVPASVEKNVDKALLKIPFTSQMKLDNTDTAPVYGDALNFTVKAEVKPEGAADFTSANELCNSSDFEIYLSDVLLSADDYTITLSDGTLSVAVSKTIDAGAYKFTIKGVSGYVKDAGAECTVTIGRKAFTGDISVPTAENETTCGHKLSEVKLSSNEWKWADGTIITEVGNNGYEAVFTVTDDNNYDYTGVEGYDKAAHTITRTIAVTVNNHLTEVTAKAATCDKDGNSQYFICDCGKLFTDSTAKTETTLADVTIKAAGHKFGDWVTTKEPTSTSTGIKTRTCSVCGATEEDTIPKKSGGGSSRPSGGNSSTSDSKPSINGKQKSWSDISSDIAKLPAGGSATINTNGETNVPADVIKSIKDSKAKVEFVIDSTRSWIVDGAKITAASAADLSILPGNADKSALRGTPGSNMKINGTGVPADLKLAFRREFAGQFANLYKLTDGKLVFQNCVKVDENGAAIISGADAKGEYVVMVCKFSDRLGDLNNDGVLNALDAAAILKEIVGTAHSANPLMGDFNSDGAVNALDASAILKWIIAA